MSPIRDLKADDHPLFRDGMRGLLDSVEETDAASGTRLSGRRLSRTLTYFFSGEKPWLPPTFRKLTERA